MDISIDDAFTHIVEEGHVLEPAGLQELQRHILAHRTDSPDPVTMLTMVSCFEAGMVYQSQFNIEGEGKVTVEMDSELVTQFLLFLSGGRDD